MKRGTCPPVGVGWWFFLLGFCGGWRWVGLRIGGRSFRNFSDSRCSEYFYSRILRSATGQGGGCEFATGRKEFLPQLFGFRQRTANSRTLRPHALLPIQVF